MQPTNNLTRHRLLLTGYLLITQCLLTSVAGEPERIISVGGAVTEIVYALDAQKNLVAVDTTSQWPLEAKVLPNVGYQRALAAEGLLSFSPSLILASGEAGPPDVLEQLNNTGIKLVRLPNQYSVEGVFKKIRTVATSLQRQPQGEQLIRQIKQELTTLPLAGADWVRPPRVLFLLDIGRGSPLGAGANTSADAMIRLAGGVNALQGFSSYKPINPESLLIAAPDIVLTTTRTLAAIGGVEALFQLPGMAMTPAAKEQAMVAMDGLLLLGFGPRINEALTGLSDHFSVHFSHVQQALAPIDQGLKNQAQLTVIKPIL